MYVDTSSGNNNNNEDDDIKRKGLIVTVDTVVSK